MDIRSPFPSDPVFRFTELSEVQVSWTPWTSETWLDNPWIGSLRSWLTVSPICWVSSCGYKEIGFFPKGRRWNGDTLGTLNCPNSVATLRDSYGNS